jgi:hypothetical protein
MGSAMASPGLPTRFAPDQGILPAANSVAESKVLVLFLFEGSVNHNIETLTYRYDTITFRS